MVRYCLLPDREPPTVLASCYLAKNDDNYDDYDLSPSLFPFHTAVAGGKFVFFFLTSENMLMNQERRHHSIFFFYHLFISLFLICLSLCFLCFPYPSACSPTRTFCFFFSFSLIIVNPCFLYRIYSQIPLAVARNLTLLARLLLQQQHHNACSRFSNIAGIILQRWQH